MHRLRQMLQPESALYLNQELLAELIPAAQRGNAQAMERLCKGFVLLIYDLTKRENIYRTLKEDGVNIAWEAFLKLVKGYKGNDFLSFPGLAKKVILNRLYRALKRQEERNAPLVSYEQRVENGQEPADTANPLADFLEQDALRQAVQQLAPEQQQLLYNTLILEQPLAQQAEILGLSTHTVRRKYKKALLELREILGTHFPMH